MKYYNNPYSTITEKRKYHYYYYAYTKKGFCEEDCLKYAESIKFRIQSKKYATRETRAALIIDDTPIYHECNDEDDRYDKEGIIDENKWYVFYKHKVYSKERYKYLNIHRTKKYGNYVVLNCADYNKSKHYVK